MAPRDTRASGRGTATRRTVLRSGAAAALTLGGVGATTSSVAGFEGDDGDVEGEPDFPRVSTRDHFYVHWWYGDQLRSGHTATDYDTVGDVPGYTTDTDDPPEELVVPVHGWQVEPEDAPDNFATVEAALEDNDYDHPVVGFSYDSDSSLNEWWAATDIAERNGAKLAAFLTDYADENPDTALRITGHSLGARVVVATLRELDQNDRTDVVTSATLLGGAIDDDSVAVDGEWGPHIEAATGRFDNFWKDGDDVLQYIYKTGAFDDAVGEAGCEGEEPSNYTDHNVDYVPDHYSYYQPSEGCMSDVVETF